MGSATLFFIASTVGVLFGWQPMPDGSARYEYLVQLDPELVATLEAGGSIPISSDIPADIQPIGRIRIVVGSGSLPRTRLSNALSASVPTEKKSRAGLVETQHRVSPVQPTSDRYGNSSSQAILPPSNSNPGFSQAPQNGSLPVNNPAAILPLQSTQGLADSLPGATQQLGNQLGNQLRNVGESVRTDAQQMFGKATNEAVSGVGGQIGNTVNQWQQGLQESILPSNQTAQQTRETVDQYGRPLRGQPTIGNNQNNSNTILPPGSAAPQQNFAGSQSNSRGQRLDQPVTSRQDNWQASPWNNSVASTQGHNSPATVGNISPPPQTNTTTGTFNAPWPALPKNDYRDDSQNQASQQPNKTPLRTTPQSPWPNNHSNDRFDLANHPSSNQPPTTGNASGQTNQNDQWARGPLFPPKNSTTSPNLVTDNRDTNPAQGTVGNNPQGGSAAPEIRRDMLNGPADAEVVSANGQTSQPASSSTSSQTSTRQPQANDFGWDNPSLSSKENSPSQNSSPTRNASLLVLSWVGFSGSFFGNVYLFWSFWDVRNKYRGLVHNTRNSGSKY